MLPSFFSAITSLTEIFLAFTTCISLIFYLFKKDQNLNSLTIFFVALFFLAAFLIAVNDKTQQVHWNGMFYGSDYTSYARVLIYLVAGILLYPFSRFLVTSYQKKLEWLVLFSLSTIGGAVAVTSNHLLILFIGIELSHLCQYILSLQDRDCLLNAEASVRFFSYGAISSVIMLFGISLIYGFSGTCSFNSLFYFFDSIIYDLDHAGAIIGVVFVLISLCIKLPLIPFHSWITDIFQTKQHAAILFINTMPKIITTFVLIQLLSYPFYGLFTFWRYLFAIFGIITMFWASITALKQKNIYRLLAYSTVMNMGILVIGFTVGGDLGLKAILFYLFTYVLTTFGILVILGWVNTWNFEITYVSDLKKLRKIPTIPYLAFIVFIFSLAGIPPLPGFFAKVYMLQAVFNRSSFFLALCIVISSVISAGYYIYILKKLAFSDDDKKDNETLSLGKNYFLVLSVTLFVLIIMALLVIKPSYFLDIFSTIAITALHK